MESNKDIKRGSELNIQQYYVTVVQHEDGDYVNLKDGLDCDFIDYALIPSLGSPRIGSVTPNTFDEIKKKIERYFEKNNEKKIDFNSGNSEDILKSLLKCTEQECLNSLSKLEQSKIKGIQKSSWGQISSSLSEVKHDETNDDLDDILYVVV